MSSAWVGLTGGRGVVRGSYMVRSWISYGSPVGRPWEAQGEAMGRL